jgi:hypothetical protein
MLEFMVGIISAICWFVLRCLNTVMFALVSCAVITTRDLPILIEVPQSTAPLRSSRFLDKRI